MNSKIKGTAINYLVTELHIERYSIQSLNCITFILLWQIKQIVTLHRSYCIYNASFDLKIALCKVSSSLLILFYEFSQIVSPYSVFT